MDLLVQVGDTIQVGNGIYLESEEPFTIFGLESRKRTFSSWTYTGSGYKTCKWFRIDL